MIRADVNQLRLRAGQKLSRRDLARTLDALSRALRKKGTGTLSVAFISPAEMRRLNRSYRKRNCITDVLSFPEEKEVLICYEQAKYQADDLRHSVRDEVIFLLVHGILHVFGYDHERPRGARRMFPLQTRILKSLRIDSRL